MKLKQIKIYKVAVTVVNISVSGKYCCNGNGNLRFSYRYDCPIDWSHKNTNNLYNTKKIG